MTKLQWGIISLILLVLVLTFNVWNNWLNVVYTEITFLNDNFFSVMPAWLNFLIGTIVLVLVIFTARQLRK